MTFPTQSSMKCDVRNHEEVSTTLCCQAARSCSKSFTSLVITGVGWSIITASVTWKCCSSLFQNVNKLTVTLRLSRLHGVRLLLGHDVRWHDHVPRIGDYLVRETLEFGATFNWVSQLCKLTCGKGSAQAATEGPSPPSRMTQISFRQTS